MILKKELKMRANDLDRLKKGKRAGRRMHLLVKCDDCGHEWWAIKCTYIKTGCYHLNNEYNKDFCRICKTKLDVKSGKRKKWLEIDDKDTIKNFSSFYPSNVAGCKGKRTRGSYKRVKCDDKNHPRMKSKSNMATGTIQEHILVMEKHLGRYLTPEEQVHHINGIKRDNRIENLYLCKNIASHTQTHKSMEELVYNLIKDGTVIFDKDQGKYVKKEEL